MCISTGYVTFCLGGGEMVCGEWGMEGSGKKALRMFMHVLSGDLNPGVRAQAEAIIANPVCYGHTACAEKLKVPIHMFFTMPWTPTTAFPHPMARIM